MSQREDCYFFFNSTCTKGENCRFRHCEAAMGSKRVCRFWLQSRCLNIACSFRHTDIKNIRKKVECHWEKQPGGCRKQDCTFHHLKPRPVGQRHVRLARTSVKRRKPGNVAPDQRVESSGRVCWADARRRPCRRFKRKNQGRRRREDCNRGHPVLPAKDDDIDFIIKALEELKLEDSVNTESHVLTDVKWSPVPHTSSNERPDLKRKSELRYLNGEPHCKRAKI